METHANENHDTLTSCRTEGCSFDHEIITKQSVEIEEGFMAQPSEQPSASELCDLWVFHVTLPMRNASVNLNQVLECHF